MDSFAPRKRKAMNYSFTPRKTEAIDSSGMFSDWRNLPAHLLDCVLERLEALVDYLHFGDVCMPWTRVARDHRSRFCKPMLLICSSDAEKEDLWNVFDVMDDKVIGLQVRLPKRRFCGFSKGWLVTVDETFKVSLMNPFARVQGDKEKENSVIHLPPLNPPDLKPFRRDYWFTTDCNTFVPRAILSADPILNANDCIVTVIHEDSCQVAFIRLGKDTNWTYIHMDTISGRTPKISDLVHVGDRLYGIDICNRFVSFGDIAKEPLVEILTQRHDHFKIYTVMRRYFVHLNDSRLLMVERRENCYKVYQFKIYEINLDTLEWVEQYTLGDGAIFVGENSAIYVLASNFSGCRPDCIYFNSEWNRFEWNVENFGVYNIKTKHIDLEPYTPKAMTLLRMTQIPPIWVMPNFLL